MSASIIESLVISGSRKSDGSANASGKVWAYLPGTSTTAQLYSDTDGTLVLTQPLVLDAGGLVPRATAPDGVFTSIPIRLYIEDADGVVVTDTLFTPATASTVSIDNAAMSGATMDDVLTASLTSFGGQDFKYLESGGATPRTVHDKFQEQGIWVTDFPDVDPTGVSVSTTGIQAAINRGATLGVNVYFPDGTFKTDGALVLQSATGVQLIGAGRGATLIKPTHATANGFTFATCTDCGVRGLSILHTTGSTGAAIATSDSPRFKVSDVYAPANGTYVGFAYGIDISGSGDFDHITYCELNADTVAIRSNTTSASKPQVLIGNQIGATSLAPVSPTSGVEFNGGNGDVYAYGNRIFGATNNVLFNAALTGTNFRFYGNSIASINGSIPFNTSGLATDPNLRQEGNDADGYVTSQASGGGGGSAFTPSLGKGMEPHIRLTSGGAAVLTVGAPTPTPTTTMRGLHLVIKITAAAGGAITARFNAVYVLVGGGTDIVVADGNTEAVDFLWDVQTSEWRECYRSVTAT